MIFVLVALAIALFFWKSWIKNGNIPIWGILIGIFLLGSLANTTSEEFQRIFKTMDRADAQEPSSNNDTATKLPPELAALQQYYPTQFADLLAKTDHMSQSTADQIAIEQDLDEVVNKIIADNREHISANNFDRFFVQIIPELKALRDDEPFVCVHSFTNGLGVGVLDPNFSNGTRIKDQEIITAILIQIAIAPAATSTPISNNQLKRLVQNAFANLSVSEQSIAQTLISNSNPPLNNNQAKAICDFYINFFSSALNGPPGTIKSLILMN
jgi:hypothetical protein